MAYLHRLNSFKLYTTSPLLAKECQCNNKVMFCLFHWLSLLDSIATLSVELCFEIHSCWKLFLTFHLDVQQFLFYSVLYFKWNFDISWNAKCICSPQQNVIVCLLVISMFITCSKFTRNNNNVIFTLYLLLFLLLIEFQKPLLAPLHSIKNNKS